MLRGLWKLTWVEFKVFMREPMGSVSTLVLPVILFLLLGNLAQRADSEAIDVEEFVGNFLPVLIAMIITLNGVTSLVTILSIYREGGILKRLRATPLSPITILTAHVLVKLSLTGINIVMLLLVGKTFFSITMAGSVAGFALAVAISAISIFSLGFVIASVVPAARFSQLIAGVVLYPLLGISGIFSPVDLFPVPLRAVAFVSPLTHAVTLMKATWEGLPWSQLGLELTMLGLAFVSCILISTKVFRWE